MKIEFESIVKNWSKAQRAGAVLPCPRCGKMKVKEKVEENALSRRADIYVCSICGTEEAIEDLQYSGNAEQHSDVYKESFVKKWWLIREVLGNEDVIDMENEWELEVKRTAIVTQEDVDSIMCSALEGGINYWCCKAEVIEETYYGEYASEQISRGGSLRLYDSEDDETYVLTLEKLLNGIRLACKDGFGDGWFDGDTLDCCRMDANDADVIVQYALFRDMVFS